MSIQVKLRRGTTSQHSTFTGSEGEVTVDTDKDVVVVHDGTTAGGHPMVKASSLATVATSGDYNDLINTPSGTFLTSSDIGVTVQGYSSVLANTTASFTAADETKLDGIAAGAEVNVNADWNAVSGDAQILNKPSFATVATTGVYADLTGKPTLGTAAATASTDYATAAQGALADSAVQPAVIANMLETSDIGVTVQGYNVNTVIDVAYVHTDNNYTTAEQTKLAGIAAGAEVNVNADWNAVSGDAQILNKPTLGTAAGAAITDFATAAQGALADSAVQPAAIANMLETSDIGVTVQGYSTVLAGTTASFTVADETKLDGIAAGAEVNVNADWNAVSGDAQILNKPILATVATTGAYADLTGKPTLGTAAATASTDYATAAQGTLADSAVQPAAIANMLETADIGVTVQGYSSVLANTTASFTTADETKLDGIAAGAEVNVNADWNAASGDAQILNKPTLGTAAATNSTDYATAAQGALADSAVQPAAITNMLETSDIGVTVQGYSSVLANTTASFTTADEAKLDGIQAGAEVNVNADWNAVSGDAQILNKPTLYSDADVDTHLNTSTATTDQVLSWNGTDYDWIDQSGAVTSVNGQTGVVVLDAADVGAEPADATILKDADIGVTVQGYSAILAGTTASFTTADETKLDGIQAGAEVNVNADWNAVSGDAQILNKPTLYSDSSVDTHLNTATATVDQVLSWNGTDYDWVDQSGGGGGGASAANIQEFTTVGSSTWTKPTGAQLVHVVVFSGGGGGGSGQRGVAGTFYGGGSGGGGGARLEQWFPASALSASETITVGAGGTGGASPTVAGAGIDGQMGGDSSFGSHLIASISSAFSNRGQGGGTATKNGGSGGLAVAEGVWTGAAVLSANGGNSVVSSTAYNGTPGNRSNFRGGGGGSGGGQRTSPSPLGGNGGDGGKGGNLQFGVVDLNTGGGGAGAIWVGGTTTNGSNGADSPNTLYGGSGGGGGAHGSGAVGGRGGDGGFPSGGGGGGGGTNLGSSLNSGAGGDGGNGYVRVTTYF